MMTIKLFDKTDDKTELTIFDDDKLTDDKLTDDSMTIK
jgi:hypothetical protein